MSVCEDIGARIALNAQNSALVNTQMNFAFNTLRDINAAQPYSTTVFSPLSVAFFLSVLFDFARDQTAVELKNLFGGYAAPLTVFNYYLDIVNKATHSKYSFIMANAFFADRSYFIRVYNNKTDTDAIYGRYSDEIADETTKRINGYTSNMTGGQITNLVSADELAGSSEIVLINAIYFKAFWKRYFDKTGTNSGKFYRSATETVKAEFMTLFEDVNILYYENNFMKCIALPYRGDEVKAYFILPRLRFALNQVIEKFTAREFNNILNGLVMTDVTGVLPKLRLSSEIDIKKILKKRLPLAFSRFADYSGIARNLVFDQFKHNAMFQMNETGSDATARTSVMFVNYMSSKKHNFYANEPFLLILANKEKTILFASVVRL